LNYANDSVLPAADVDDSGPALFATINNISFDSIDILFYCNITAGAYPYPVDSFLVDLLGVLLAESASNTPRILCFKDSNYFYAVLFLDELSFKFYAEAAKFALL
jgi:hypothetical protein